MTSDKDLGMDRAITRRDFLNGVAIGVGGAIAGRALPEISWLAATGITQDAPGYYPPALTGMRGSHDGSFEVSHALRDGRFRPTGQSVATGEPTISSSPAAASAACRRRTSIARGSRPRES